MAEHLYSIDYLEQTTQLLGSLKKTSYQPFGTIAEGKIADIGCGAGDDAMNMARMFGEKIFVTGIDYAPEMIEKASSSAANIPNITFQKGSAENLPFADSELDGLRNERLIQHLPDPQKAFAEFYRVLKPGSPLVVVETDWNSISFYNGDTTIAQKLNHYLTFNNVKNGNAAANVIRYMKEAGFGNIHIDLFPLSSHSLQQVTMMLRTDHALLMMKEQKIISDEDYNSFQASLEDADRNRYFACSINLVVATATK
jgi:ubiquinone/menaquinone biosynthesis C-methylase UbiE